MIFGSQINEKIINEVSTNENDNKSSDTLKMNDNTIIYEKNLLKSGEFNNTYCSDDKILISEGYKTGVYKSPVIETSKFKELVASFNCKTKAYSSINLKVSIRANGEFSQWFSYGEWSTDGKNKGSISNQSDEIAAMYVDEIKVKDGVTADGIKFMLTLSRDDEKLASPEVSVVSFTFKKADLIESEEYESCNIELKVPEFSQMVVQDIGKIICSPTTVCMLMNYYGNTFTPEDVAVGVKDNGADIYGNWVYNMAFASEQGFETRVERATGINDIKQYIKQGIPVGVSIRIKDNQRLDNAPYKQTAGHLLLVRGFTCVDGTDYVIVNDPAATDAATVRRLYKLEQFENVWSGIMYIVKIK